MKNLLMVSLCLFSLVGCQTYPKKPTYVQYGSFKPINKNVPIELQPFELPTKVEYMDDNQVVPKQIIVISSQSLDSNTITTPVGSIVVTPVVNPMITNTQVEESDVKK